MAAAGDTGGVGRRGGPPEGGDVLVLEALGDLQKGAIDVSVTATYLILMGYWHSFEEWETEPPPPSPPLPPPPPPP